MSGEVRFDASATCDACGRFGAYCFDGEWLCADCYEARGSCCAEFDRDSGMDDDEPSTPDEARSDTTPGAGRQE